jgi:hypothetical protein
MDEHGQYATIRVFGFPRRRIPVGDGDGGIVGLQPSACPLGFEFNLVERAFTDFLHDTQTNNTHVNVNKTNFKQLKVKDHDAVTHGLPVVLIVGQRTACARLPSRPACAKLKTHIYKAKTEL